MTADTGGTASNGGGRRMVILIGLVLTLGLVLVHANEFGERFLHLTALQSRDLFWWLLLFVTLLYVVLVERRSLKLIGFRRPTWKTLVFGIGAAIVLFASEPLIAVAMVHFHLNPQAGSGAAHTLTSQPYWYKMLLVTRAALAEEVVFRGYAIERLEELTGSKTVAVLVSTVVFVLAHLAYWGWAPLIGVSAAGLLLALLYVWRRDLIANMIAHFVIDAVSILL